MKLINKIHLLQVIIASQLALAFSACAESSQTQDIENNVQQQIEIDGNDSTNEPHVSENVLSPKSQRNATQLSIEFIENFHFRGKMLDDSLSEQVFYEYIKSLDPNKLYFKQSDIDEFVAYKDQFDEFLHKATLNVPFEIYHRFTERLQSRIKFSLEMLDKPFEFDTDESFVIDRENENWLNDDNYNDTWRKKIKIDYLSLKLNEKTDEQIIEDLKERYDNALRRSTQLNNDDIFQSFINSYASLIDPHTSYFSPRISENFQIQMSLSLEGIGAVLQTDNEYTKVRSVVKGGPADKSGQISAGDFIVGVDQDNIGEIESVIGWRVDDVVEKIRGPRGSVVRLEVQPKVSTDGKTKMVTIIRDKINLEEQAASARIIEHTEQDSEDVKKIGVIELPTFYRDFSAQDQGDKNFRSTTRDVRKLLDELMDQDIDGLIVDLRNNGGGSLDEANSLTGLFIKSGPIVQVLDSEGNLDINMDPDKSLIYSGPLAVLINRNSASASEIFAAAIQDYKRGIVLGEPSYGKGTVQRLIDLSRYAPSYFNNNDENLGQLKMTIAQFFRINGGTTQFKGVEPDIIYPTVVGEVDYGERSLDNALPWVQIEPTEYNEFKPSINYRVLDSIKSNHLQRIELNPGFEYIVYESRLFDELDNRKELSLELNKRQQIAEERLNNRLEKYNAFQAYLGKDPITKEELLENEEDDELDEEEEIDKSGIYVDSNIKEDPILYESSNIIMDYINTSS